jgi:rhamnosyltransferase
MHRGEESARRLAVNDGCIVIAVVVSYQPNPQEFVERLEAIGKQVGCVVIVDNASNATLTALAKRWSSARAEKSHWIQMGDNVGVGAAQNRGCQWATSHGATYVIFFDQDSHPDPGMVATLRTITERLLAEGRRVAAVGPQYRDPRGGGGESVFFRLSLGKQVAAQEKNDPVSTDFLVSSGSLVPVESLNEIGPMDEALFIDHVDTEWCCRAKSMGYGLYGTRTAGMTHALGAGRIRVPFTRNKTVAIHEPQRYYFMVRNSLLLQKRWYPAISWRIFECRRLTRLIIVYGLLLPNCKPRLYWIVRGLWDGIWSKAGPLLTEAVDKGK